MLKKRKMTQEIEGWRTGGTKTHGKNTLKNLGIESRGGGQVVCWKRCVGVEWGERGCEENIGFSNLNFVASIVPFFSSETK